MFESRLMHDFLDFLVTVFRQGLYAVFAYTADPQSSVLCQPLQSLTGIFGLCYAY